MMRWNCFETSASIPTPPTWPRNSTAVTSAPSRCQTDPSSTPMTPAPIRIILEGTFARDSAPVDETIRSSSILMFVVKGKNIKKKKKKVV